MATILITAQCEDQAKWEAGFRTHADFFRSAYGITTPIGYGFGEDNYIGTCFETGDVAKFMAAIELPETAEAMEGDGLMQDTVQIFVLDKQLAV
ncbi:MAG TPA: hypothetical protein VMU38_06610 [Candidatus Binatia bacterium]|nr:hypothetical protein [Candidatus Binatia bacterium]